MNVFTFAFYVFIWNFDKWGQYRNAWFGEQMFQNLNTYGGSQNTMNAFKFPSPILRFRDIFTPESIGKKVTLEIEMSFVRLPDTGTGIQPGISSPNQISEQFLIDAYDGATAAPFTSNSVSFSPGGSGSSGAVISGQTNGAFAPVETHFTGEVYSNMTNAVYIANGRLVIKNQFSKATEARSYVQLEVGYTYRVYLKVGLHENPSWNVSISYANEVCLIHQNGIDNGLTLDRKTGNTTNDAFLEFNLYPVIGNNTGGLGSGSTQSKALVELKISNSGEVLYRSPGSFVEYFKDPSNTKKTKDIEGWVATGDAGFIDEETGHLKIIDRAKDVGKLKQGSLFAPKYVENKLKFFPNILEAVLFGSGKEYCVAMINIDLTAVGNWAEKNNISYASYQELAGHPDVYKMVAEHIREVNLSLSKDKNLSNCQIRRFLVLHKELDPDDGEITRTRKVRRNLVSDKYSDLIKALYDGSKEIYTETEVTYEDGRKGKISASIVIQELEETFKKVEAA